MVRFVSTYCVSEEQCRAVTSYFFKYYYCNCITLSSKVRSAKTISYYFVKNVYTWHITQVLLAAFWKHFVSKVKRDWCYIVQPFWLIGDPYYKLCQVTYWISLSCHYLPTRLLHQKYTVAPRAVQRAQRGQVLKSHKRAQLRACTVLVEVPRAISHQKCSTLYVLC